MECVARPLAAVGVGWLALTHDTISQTHVTLLGPPQTRLVNNRQRNEDGGRGVMDMGRGGGKETSGYNRQDSISDRLLAQPFGFLS